MAAAVAPAIPGFSFDQNAALQLWITGVVNEKMDLASTAVDFINRLDTKQAEAVAAIGLEANRMDVQVANVTQAMADMGILKTAIEKTHAAVLEITAGTSSFADSTRSEIAEAKAAIEATSVAGNEAHKKAEWLHSQMSTLFDSTETKFADITAKTEATFVETEKKSLAMRAEIRDWSAGFATQVQEMCRTGNF